MKIANISYEVIEFDNGETIGYHHEQDCCECNYADFEYLRDETLVRNAEFTSPLSFEKVGETGFRFGNPGNMFFVPCYSSQNGYYSNDLTIRYNGNDVVQFDDLEIA